MARQVGKGSLMNSKSTLCQGSPGVCSVGRFRKVKVKCLYLNWTTLLFTQATLHRGPVVIGLVLLQEEAEVPGENLRCLVQSIWTTLFSHLNKVTLIIYIPAWSRSRTLVTVVRPMHYHCYQALT